MKVLLDENITKLLKKDLLDEHEVYTVHEKGWQSYTNGELLKRMIDDDFEVLITFDGSLSKQQNFNKYPIPVIVLSAYRSYYARLLPMIPLLQAALRTELPIGTTVISEKDVV
jgi:hypothetical protein